MQPMESEMKIKDVLDYKGGDLKTVSPGARLDLVLALLIRLGIASVVVIDADRRPLGIVTEHNALWAIAMRGTEALELSAAEIMESPAPTCSPNDMLRHAMGVMTRQRIRHLVVQEDGVVRGIVSIGDLVKAHIRDTEMENRVLREIA